MLGPAVTRARVSVGADDIWLPEIIARVAAFLPRNDVACVLRLVNKQASNTLRLPEHTRVVLSQPVPTDTFAAHWTAPDACRGLTLALRHKLIFLTAGSGVVANVEVAVAAAGCVLSADLITEAGHYAARAGQLDSCRWLLDPVRAPPNFDWAAFCASAGEGGHKHIISWSLAAGAEACGNTPRSSGITRVSYDYGAVASAAVGAARGGHVELLDWLLTERPADFEKLQTEELLEAVARGCDAATLGRLWAGAGERVFGFFRPLVLGAVIGSPTPDWQAKAEWLMEQAGIPLDELACRYAHRFASHHCADGWVERSDWINGRARVPTPPGKLAEVIDNDNLAAVQYTLAQGGWTCIDVEAYIAAHEGRLAILQAFMAAPKCAARLERCAKSAAVGGQLAVLEWLVETYGVERLGGWSSELATEGAASDSVEVMAWLRERGCLYGLEKSWSEAASAGCEAALELLAAYDCPQPTDGKPYVTAARRRDLCTLAVLRRLGLPLGSAHTFTQSVSRSHPWGGVPALQWLLDNGCPVDWDEAVIAAPEDDVEAGVRQWVAAQWTMWVARQ